MQPQILFLSLLYRREPRNKSKILPETLQIVRNMRQISCGGRIIRSQDVQNIALQIQRLRGGKLRRMVARLHERFE